MIDSTILGDLSPSSVFCALTHEIVLPFTIPEGKDTTGCWSRIQHIVFVWFWDFFLLISGIHWISRFLRPAIQIHWTPSQIQALICSPTLPTHLRPVDTWAQWCKKATSVLWIWSWIISRSCQYSTAKLGFSNKLLWYNMPNEHLPCQMARRFLEAYLQLCWSVMIPHRAS